MLPALLAGATCSTPTTQPTHARSITLALGGDVHVGHDATIADVHASLDLLRGADVRVVNLEGPLGALTPGGDVNLATDPARAGWLRGRVEMVTHANNHDLDAGEDGRAATRAVLVAQGIVVADRAGAGRTRGVEVMALDASHGEVRVPSNVPAVVSVHFGREELLTPDAADIALAHALVEAGAVLVVGHGPHVPRGVERYRGAVIAYSVGNLYFGCTCTTQTDAYVVRATVDVDGRRVDARLRPVRAGIMAVASWSTDGGLHELITALSRDLGTTLVRDADGWLAVGPGRAE